MAIISLSALEMQVCRVVPGKLWLCPVLTALSIALMKVVYLAAVWQCHVKPILPYTSDAGSTHPEAAFFGLLINSTAIFSGITGWLRFKQVQHYVQLKSAQSDEGFTFLNLLAFSCATSSALVQIVASSFRTTEWGLTHFILMGIASTLLNLYVCINVFQCKQFAKWKIESSPKTLTGLAYSVVCGQVLQFLLFAVSFIVSEGNVLNADWRRNWSPGQSGYWAHLGATTLDWTIINCYALFALCLARRFRCFTAWETILYRKEF